MTLIIWGIVAVVIFFTKGIWGKYIVLLVSKMRKEKIKDIDNARSLLVNSGSVFSPTGTKRTFAFGIEIEEQGDGTAKFSIVKLKEKEV